MTIRTVFVAAVLAASPAVARAQQPTAASDAQAQSASSKIVDFVHQHMPEVDQADGIHLTKHVALVFGDIEPGEGVAAGGAVSETFADGGFAQLKGEYSTRRFSLVQLRYDSRQWLGKRASFTTRARWQDAPTLAMFQLGPASPLAGAEFGERRVELRLIGTLRVTRGLRLEAGGGVERDVTDRGELLPPGEESLPSVPSLPGLGARTWFERFSVRAVGDWRGPDHAYPRSGTYVSAGLDGYRDWQHRTYSFYESTGTAEHLVPIFDGRGVVDLTGFAWVTSPARGSTVPFFLMPTLGGGDHLEGYRLYRFRDRDAAVLRGEYRWAILDFVDLAGAYEIGTVAPSLNAFRTGDLKHSIAGGIRVHTSRALVLSLDLAHSREGFEVNVIFSAPH